MTHTRRPDGKPETPADKRFFDLRESGYRGPIDQDGHATTEQEFLARFERDRDAAQERMSGTTDE